jgi:hypothetical protein
MKKVDIDELTRKLNEFRMDSLNKTFTGSELREKLCNLGFNPSVCGYIANTFFPYEYMGKQRLYEVPKTPIHKNSIESYYKKNREYARKSYEKKMSTNVQSQSEEEALALLASKGYQIRKCVGFDLERFAKENPVTYKKYLKYEIV